MSNAITMCGINGIYKYNTFLDSDRQKLADMNEQMPYRGPDESDIWFNDKAGLSQVRLSIIGVANGRQPITNEDQTKFIVCNGEIYNYKELKEELIGRGHIFKTDSDTEVILHLFEEKGERCLQDLRGMFAFAIYDVKKQKLFIARDIAGKKPLYFLEFSEGFVFSSEIKTIKKAYLQDYQMNWSVIKDCLKYSYPQDLSKTYIRNINRLQPGEYALISQNSKIFNRYWKKKNDYSFKGTYEEAIKQTKQLLKESVKLRLRSDVPIAILLSGGIDSGAIASIASETNSNIHAITVGYKGAPDCDERRLAKRLAKEKGLIWHEIELDENDYKSYFEEYVKYIDEPVCDVASIAQWGIYKKAKELGFKVLLSGNGGDELFYGYPSHNLTGDNLQFLSELKKHKGKSRLKYIARQINQAYNTLLTYEAKPFGGYHVASLDTLKFKWPDSLEFSSNDAYHAYFNDEKLGIDKVYSYLFNVWLPNNCYYLSDKLGMGNSLELRAPFADVELIKFVSSLPINYKYHKGSPKKFLKDCLRGIVPDYILDAQKRGFTPPANAINAIVKSYKSQFFKQELITYNQVLVDKFLDMNINE